LKIVGSDIRQEKSKTLVDQLKAEALPVKSLKMGKKGRERDI
jgi:hypothetical protein